MSAVYGYCCSVMMMMMMMNFSFQLLHILFSLSFFLIISLSQVSNNQVSYISLFSCVDFHFNHFFSLHNSTHVFILILEFSFVKVELDTVNHHPTSC